MTKETLEFALSVLSKQDEHTRKAYASKAPKIERESQKSYAEGIRTALEIILTEGYTQPMPKEYEHLFHHTFYEVKP